MKTPSVFLGLVATFLTLIFWSLIVPDQEESIRWLGQGWTVRSCDAGYRISVVDIYHIEMNEPVHEPLNPLHRCMIRELKDVAPESIKPLALKRKYAAIEHKQSLDSTPSHMRMSIPTHDHPRAMNRGCWEPHPTDEIVEAKKHWAYWFRKAQVIRIPGLKAKLQVFNCLDLVQKTHFM